MEGDADSLKESVIGVTLFGLSGSDAAKYSRVRMLAIRVREKLSTYYSARRPDDGVLIEIPKGGYVPVFSWLPPAEISEHESVLLPGAVGTRDLRGKHEDWAVVSAVVVLALTVVLLGMNFASRAPATSAGTLAIRRITQLTFDGVDKHGPLLLAGRRLVFNEFIDDVDIPASLSLTSGVVTRLELPIRGTVLDVSADGAEFVIRGESTGDPHYRLWTWRRGELPNLVADIAPDSAGWISPNKIGYVALGKLSIIGQSQSPRPVVFGYSPQLPRWSAARHLLRFTALDSAGRNHSIWQVSSFNEHPRLAVSYPEAACCGSWARDGKRYYFQSPDEAGGDIWVLDETLTHTTIARRLSNGPIPFSWPAPAFDEHLIYAIGSQLSAEMLRFDSTTNKFEPYGAGRGGFALSWSADLRQIAYTAYPDRTLWKMRADGTGRVQLTAPPMVVTEPHWAPDNKQISFMGEMPGKPARAYVVSTDGHTRTILSDSGPSQGVPTWMKAGREVVVGEWLHERPPSAMAIHAINVATHAIRDLPGSSGLWNPRCSPDGRYVAATTTDFGELRIYEVQKDYWRSVVKYPAIESLAWTADSESLFFRAADEEGSRSGAIAIFKLNLRTHTCKRVVSLRGWKPPVGAAWCGVTPQGDPLVLAGVSSPEIYALQIGEKDEK